MRGRSEDLCHNIGMLEDIGQIQWEYFSLLGTLLAYYMYVGRIYATMQEMLENICQIQWEYFCLSGSLLAYCKYAGDE